MTGLDNLNKIKENIVKKKLSILIALVMAISLCLVPAVAVSAAEPIYETEGSCPTDITIEVVDNSVVWTIDIDMASSPVSNGHVGYGLVISLDNINPAFQIHGNDGVDHFYEFGTHLYSEWVAGEGWNGWLTGWNGTGDRLANNIPVTDVDWVEATGERYIAENPDGVFTVTIDKAKLAPEFRWAVQVMANTSDTQYPAEWVMWSGDASTFATYTIPGAATTATTEIPEDLIQISVSPPTLDFGEVYRGQSSASLPLEIANTGSVLVNVSTSTGSAFYQAALTIDGVSVVTWNDTIASPGSIFPSAQVTVPSDWASGIETGTIIFWAEAK